MRGRRATWAAVGCAMLAGPAPAQGPVALREGDVLRMRTAGQPDRQLRVVRLGGADDQLGLAEVQDALSGARYSVPLAHLARLARAAEPPTAAQPPTAGPAQPMLFLAPEPPVAPAPLPAGIVQADHRVPAPAPSRWVAAAPKPPESAIDLTAAPPPLPAGFAPLVLDRAAP